MISALQTECFWFAYSFITLHNIDSLTLITLKQNLLGTPPPHVRALHLLGSRTKKNVFVVHFFPPNYIVCYSFTLTVAVYMWKWLMYICTYTAGVIKMVPSVYTPPSNHFYASYLYTLSINSIYLKVHR